MSDSHDHGKTPSAAVPHDAPGGGGHEHHDIHIGLYLWVGVFLLLATVLTVGLSFVDFGSSAMNITIGLLLASIKVAFVGAIFMHLKGEKKTIWQPLYFTIFFVLGLFLLTLFHYYDPIFSTVHSTH